MANIVIVGGNQGIGYYMMERLLQQGHSVAVLDLDVNALKKLQAAYPQNLLPVVADARDFVYIQQGAIRRFKHLETLMPPFITPAFARSKASRTVTVRSTRRSWTSISLVLCGWPRAFCLPCEKQEKEG